MKRFSLCVLFLFIFVNLQALDITRNYIQVYGEAPKGRIPVDIKPHVYSEKDTVLLARTEIFELLSAMIYGYTFVYRVENPLLKEKGHFDLTHICRIDNKDPNIQLSQLEEATQFMRIQATYRLNEDQKLYINGFTTKAGQMTTGEGRAPWDDKWTSRLTVAFKNALQNAVLNAVRREVQSRPQFITGKIIVREPPLFTLDANEWVCLAKCDLIIEDITYRDSY